MLIQNSNNSFAKKAARAALTPNNNIANIQNNRSSLKASDLMDSHQSSKNNNNSQSSFDSQNTEIDKIVESVTNATKRLSQISTNTNTSKRKSKNHVGPWRLGRTLGRGSTGRVRLAKHSETGQLAAVKIVPKSKVSKNKDGDVVDDDKKASPYGIEREIIIMKLISHQNIMGLYDVWENKGELYLVLEYVEGGELFDYLIKKGKLQEKEAVHYFSQIISGVSYCHQFNICHRDLKPENLLLDKNLNIKIADFGMAALEINQKLLETSCGSPHYASPEIVTGKTYHGSPSDVWSCGIILFALLTGHLPFDDENIRKLLMKVQSGKFIMPNYLSPEAKDLIWRMLKVNPMERIKIQDILKHPLLKKYETSSNLKSKDSDQIKLHQYYNEVDHLKLKPADIDRDLLKSLSILFHGATESSLLNKLSLPTSSPEKIFYYLLYRYKKQHQIKERDQIKARKAKSAASSSSNGDGLLKKSKSTIQTTIIHQDGSKTVTVEKVPIEKSMTPQLNSLNSSAKPSNTTSSIFPSNLPSLPSTPKKKRISKTPHGQIQIPVSSSYRRGVSFSAKSNNNDQISRSSSKKSITSMVFNISNSNVNHMKKRQSILPPLPDLDVDWLNFGPDGIGSEEFASLYEEIFNYKSTSKKPSPKRSHKSSPKRKLSFTTSSPLVDADVKVSPIKSFTEESSAPQPETQSSKPESSENSTLSRSLIVKTDQRNFSNSSRSTTLRHPLPLPLPRQLGNIDINNRRNVSEPTPSAPPLLSTLDPKYKPRNASDSSAQVLHKLGVNLTRTKKSSSKIYYSKSSTSINLASILKEDSKYQPLPTTIPESPDADDKKSSSPPPLPKHRISSSNYPSFEDEGEQHNYDFNSSRSQEFSFDFELPTQTEIAQIVPISNGSSITVGDKVTTRDESMFEDVSTITTAQQRNFLKISSSSYSMIKNHKKATSIDHKVLSPSMDIRGSIFNNPSELKDDNIPTYYNNIPSKKFQSPLKHNIADDIDETKSTILDNSLFDDNTDDDLEFANAKRVTMIFDDYQDESDYNKKTSPIKDKLSTRYPSPKKAPLKSSPLKSIQQTHFKKSSDGTLMRNELGLEPQRIAPKAPEVIKPNVESHFPKKSNWFTKFFSSLLSPSSSSSSSQPQTKNPTTHKKDKKQDVHVFKSSIPTSSLKKSIRVVLELKRKEGTLTSFIDSGDYITATVPPSFALGQPLNFKITFDYKDNEIRLIKIKGSNKIFKKLISAMEFVIESESSQ